MRRFARREGMEFARGPLMRRRPYLFPALLLVFGSVHGAESQGPLSLQDAFGVVEKVNLNVLISREAISQAQGVAGEQRANLLPHVSLQGQQRRTAAVSITGDTVSRTPLTNRFDGKLVGDVTLLSPSQIASARAARRGVGVAEFDYRETLQTVLTSVAQTYFQHLRNRQRIVVLDANIERARVLLDLAQRQLNAGVATQIDVTRAESQLAIAQQARLQQDTTVYESELFLKRLLDFDAGAPLTLAAFTVRRVDEALFDASHEHSFFDQRADYLRTQEALAQNRELFRAARFERFGSIGLSGEYGYASPVIFDGRDERAWTGGIALSLPIFDGWRIRADQRVALAQMRAQEYRLRALELQISDELRLAAEDARSRNAQVTVAQRSEKLARDELELARRRYEEGVADNREVVDAQNSLAVASDNLVEAVYQYNLSRVELARARGDVRGILAEKAE